MPIRATIFRLSAVFIVFLASITACASVARAQVLDDPITGTNEAFSYGDLSFTISGCSFTDAGKSTACSRDNTEIKAVSTGKTGTEIEIVPISGIWSQSAGTGNTTLSFTMTVSDLTGSHGISSISNILAASVGNSKDDSLVASVISGTSIKAASSAGSLKSTADFALTTNPLSLDVSVDLDSSGAKRGDTLKLDSVALLFAPVPEPASIAVLLTGLTGLIVSRQRLTRRTARKSAR